MDKEEFESLAFPVQGVDQKEGVMFQPPGTTASARNVRAMEPGTLRIRGASRSGLSRLINDAAGTGKVQGMGVVIATDPTTVIGSGLTFEYDIESTGGGGGFSISMQAIQTADGALGNVSRAITPSFPYPPLYPRQSGRTLVAYLSGTDNNSNAIFVNDESPHRVQFVGASVGNYTVSQGDYLGSSYTLTGTVYELKNGVEEHVPSLDFTKINQTSWKIAYFAVLQSGGQIGFKDDNHSSGVLGTQTDQMLAAFCSGTTTTCGFGVNNGTDSTFIDLNTLAYTAPSTFTSGTRAVLGIAGGASAVCTDGTDFYAAGLASGGGTFIAKVKGDGSGTVIWSNSNAGPYTGSAISSGQGNATNSTTQGASCCTDGTWLYVNIPQYGVSKYKCADGSGVATVISAASIASGAGGAYTNQVQGANAVGLNMVYCNGVLAIPVQDPVLGGSPVGYTNARLGVVFVDAGTGSVSGAYTGLGPTWMPLSVGTDGTYVYVMDAPAYISGDASTVKLVKLTTAGTVVWTVNPFVAASMAFPNYVGMTCVSGSHQIIAGNPNETVVMHSTTGAVMRRTAFEFGSPQWFQNAGAA